jgi:Flp pilus assembly protein TadD
VISGNPMANLLRLIRRPTRKSLRWLLPLGLAVAVAAGGFGWSEYRYRIAMREAEQAVAACDFDRALDHYDAALYRKPHNRNALLQATRTARRGGFLPRAESYLDRYRQTSSHDPEEASLEKKLILVQQGDVQLVVAPLIELLEIRHPRSEDIFESLAMGSAQTYQTHRTMFWTTELLEKWPGNAIGRLIQAQTIDTKDRDHAIGKVRELLDDNPLFYRARNFYADTLYKTQKFREAVAEYETLNRQQSGRYSPLLGLAACYLRLDEIESARPYVEELARLYPEQSEGLLEVARLAIADERMEEAETILRRAVAIAPFDHEIRHEFAIVLSKNGKTEESSVQIERFRQIEADLILLEKTLTLIGKSPNDPKHRRDAAVICLRNNQLAEALRWLNGILEISPDDPQTHFLLAEYFEKLGDRVRADVHRRKSFRR